MPSPAPGRAGSPNQHAGDVVRIGTRASELALIQARMVARALSERGIETEIVPIRTTGDKRTAEPFAEIGAKGLFTEELEKALLRGKVECCVHSLKDLPTESPPGLVIAAVLAREDPRDVLVVTPAVQASRLDELPAGSRVGTSSVRRRALLAAHRPDLEAVDLRGNVPTRLRKLDRGSVHAAILAAAGLHRLGAHQRIAEYLEPPDWLPAPAQGAIAVQARDDDARMRDLLAPVNHGPTALVVRAERAFLESLEGGCQIPIGALVLEDDGVAVLHGFISDLGGRHLVRGSLELDPNAPERTGHALAVDMRARGAGTLLIELRGAGRVPAPQPE